MGVLIEDFVDELEASLKYLTDAAREQADSEGISSHLESFVDRAVTSYGRTALFLSGGSSIGFYHEGLLRALLSEDLMPNVFCGTSFGAVILSFLATRTNAEALDELTKLEDLWIQQGPKGALPGSNLWKICMIFRRGYVYGLEECEEHLEWFTLNMTFQEAFEKTGRVINITCTPARRRKADGLPKVLLNHITTPQVTLKSAVLASCCVPILFQPVLLMERRADGTLRPYSLFKHDEEAALEEVRMRDGSFECDTPVKAVAEFWNTHFSIVSQVNPHIAPFFYNSNGIPGRPVRFPWRKIRGGFLLSFIECWCKEDMLKLLRIVREVGLLFRIFGVDWSHVWTQQEWGDVNIVPDIRLRHYLGAADNSQDRDDMADILKRSERHAWRYFSIISHRLRVERALTELAASVSKASPSPSPGNFPFRVTSGLHLS